MRIISPERRLTSVRNWTFDELTRRQFRSRTRSAPESSESHVRRIGEARPRLRGGRAARRTSSGTSSSHEACPKGPMLRATMCFTGLRPHLPTRPHFANRRRTREARLPRPAPCLADPSRFRIRARVPSDNPRRIDYGIVPTDNRVLAVVDRTRKGERRCSQPEARSPTLHPRGATVRSVTAVRPSPPAPGW